MAAGERLELLLQELRDRPGSTVGQLAERLRASRRSVFRDLARLRERGYPIEASRGRGGGVRLHPGWGLGRVLFSPDEALGSLISLAVAEGLGLPMFGRNLRAARTKLVAAFPAAERQLLRSLRQRVLIAEPASAAVRASYAQPDARAARALETAFVRELVIEIDYVRGDLEETTRVVEPHALLLNWPAWYVLGFDRGRGDVRTFRLDRMRAVRPAAARFRPAPRRIVEAMGGLEYADPARFSL